MKILVINPTIMAFGGIGRHCCNLKKLFENSDVNIELASKSNIAFKKILFSKVVFRKKSLKQAILNSECDIVHVHGFASIIAWQSIKMALKLDKKVVYTPHFHPFSMLERPLIAKCFFMLLMRPLLHKLDAIICLNNEDSAFFSKYSDKVTTMPHWIIEETRRFRDRNIKSNMILFIGRNDSNKSPDYLLELPKKKYEIHCVINSSVGLREDFIFHQNISDDELMELYSQAALLVVPSRYEAFSYVVLEALIYSVPVLVSDNVRIVDHLQNISGITTFHYGDKKEFVSLVDGAKEKVVNVKAVQSIFSAEKAKSKLLSIYQTALRGN